MLLGLPRSPAPPFEPAILPAEETSGSEREKVRSVSISLSWASGGLGPRVEYPEGPWDGTMSLEQKSQLS